MKHVSPLLAIGLTLLTLSIGCLPSLRPLYPPDGVTSGDSSGDQATPDATAPDTDEGTLDSTDAAPDLVDDLRGDLVDDGTGDFEGETLQPDALDDADDLVTPDVEPDTVPEIDIPSRGSCIEDLEGRTKDGVIAALPQDYGASVAALFCPGLSSERADWFKIQLSLTQWAHLRVTTLSATAPAGLVLRLYSSNATTLLGTAGPLTGSAVVTISQKLGTTPYYLRVEYGGVVVDAQIDYRLDVIKGCAADTDCIQGSETCKKSEHACIPL